MYDLIIIGGGAAGLFLAANIKNRKVLLLEKMKVPGKKILLSGGGMCNLTNCDSNENFLNSFGDKKKANFLKPSLMNFSSEETRSWFENRGLPLVIRDDGKVFPASLKAQSVVDCLKREALRNDVEIKTDQFVSSVTKKGNLFTVSAGGGVFTTTNIVITTGGKSFESTGSDGSGYVLAKSLGHKIIDPTQALVAVNIENYLFSALAGNSIRQSTADFFREGDLKRYLSAQGDLLFTHKGISGPVILNNSRNIRKNDLIKVSLLPVENKESLRPELHNSFTGDPKKQIRSVLKALGLFSALADALMTAAELNKDEKCGNLNKKSRNRLISLLLDFPFKVSRKGYFSSAMVTAGGVDLNEVNRKSMESKLTKGLYFAGEILDIDGNTGGYNIQAAFSMSFLISASINRISV